MKPRIGVVGVGALGYHHARILRDLPGATLAGIYDVDEARASTVGADLGVRVFEDPESLLDSVDAVTIAVPTPAHHAVAMPALRRGLHILIEKPIAASLEEADALLAVARDGGSTIQVGHVERFNRAIRAALSFVDQPRFIESTRLAPFSSRGADVAVVLDLMIHDIDLVHTLAGSTVQSVSAMGVPVLTPFVDIANARLCFSSGAVANITASRVSRERTRKLRIFQPSGYLSLDLAAGSGEMYRLRGDMDLAEFVRDARGAQPIENYVERVALEAPEGEPLRLELEDFVRSIVTETPPSVTGDNGRDALAVALTIVGEIERSVGADLREQASHEGA